MEIIGSIVLLVGALLAAWLDWPGPLTASPRGLNQYHVERWSPFDLNVKRQLPGLPNWECEIEWRALSGLEGRRRSIFGCIHSACTVDEAEVGQ